MNQLLFNHPEYGILAGVVLYIVMMYVLYRIWDIKHTKVLNKCVNESHKEKSLKEYKNIFISNNSVKSIPIIELLDYINESVN